MTYSLSLPIQSSGPPPPLLLSPGGGHSRSPLIMHSLSLKNNILSSETMHLTHPQQMPCGKPSSFRLRFCSASIKHAGVGLFQ